MLIRTPLLGQGPTYDLKVGIMIKDALQQLKVALAVLVLLTVITGLLYPLAIFGFAQLFFPWKANGSMIEKNGTFVGSVLIGQDFSNSGYFWGRPSATTPFPYNAEASSGSNSGPSNPAFLLSVQERVSHLQQKSEAQPNERVPQALIPVDLITASGSGLDPEISPYAAYYQVHRIANVRKIDELQVRELIKSQIQKRAFGFLGEPRINVLQLNLALDNLRKDHGRETSNP